MGAGAELRMTDVPFSAEPNPSALVFINDNGKLRQTTLTIVAQYSELYELIITAHEDALTQIAAQLEAGQTSVEQSLADSLATLEATKSALDQALTQLHQTISENLEAQHDENIQVLTKMYEDNMASLSELIETGHTKLENDVKTVDDIREGIAIVRPTLGYECKNLISYPYYETSHVANGITWTVNNDGTVSASGTATANTMLIFTFRTENPSKGDYIFSGCPSGGSRTTYYQWFGLWDADTSTNVYGQYDIGSGTTVNITKEHEKYTMVMACYVYKGQTVSNLTFKPMLRRAEITDDTWEPYVPSVKKRLDTIEATVNAQPVIRTGTEVPDDTLGKDGDIYIQIIE